MDGRISTSGQESPTRRRRRIALAGGALALALVIAVGTYLAWRTPKDSPEQTVVTIASAAMSGDADTVAASIDTSSLVDSAVDEVFSDADEHRALISQYLKTHPNVTEDQVKQKARASLDEEIREHVKSGTLPKRVPLGDESLKALAAKVLARRSVRSVKVDGDIAHVTVAVPYKGKTLGVKVRMRHSGDTWKVDRVENLSDVMRQAGY